MDMKPSGVSPPAKTYVRYHVHSDYSLLDSCTKFSDYVDMAIAEGCTAIASTEHGKTSGWIEKKLLCDERGIKFMHGVEIYLTEHLEPKVRDNYHTILIAKNQQGVRELNSLMMLSSDDSHFYYNNRISFDEFLSISDNIIKTSACLASPLCKLPDDHPMYLRLANHYDYLEIQPHMSVEQAAYNKRLYNLSKNTGIPLIAGTDTHNSSQYKAECRRILMLRKGKSYGNEDDFDLTWKTYEQLVEMFRVQGALPFEVYVQAIENTNVMADSVECFELDRSIKYPILYGSRENDSRKLVEVVQSKFNEKVAAGIIPPHQVDSFKSALQEEISVFQQIGMDGFILSMHELISWCKDHGMAIGPARGSVGGSRAAYVTDIIDLNPETWHTVFSRFCNVDRVEIGDIDIDCVEADRPKIFEYIIGRFGKDFTARVGSYGTMADLSTIDDIGGALRKQWETNLQAPTAKNPWALDVVKRIKSEFTSDPDETRKKYPDLFYYYDGLLGTRVSQSVHPAGLVISPVNLSEEYGVFHKDGELCLVMDMEEAHEVGLAKYDFLLLKTVQVIDDTCKYAGIPYPKSHEIDWDDQDVWRDMLKSPGGIFQMEGDYAFLSLKKFKPASIFDMSLVTAAIRPSGASYRDELLARKPHYNPSALIDKLLENNLGYLVYQEDIIAFLQQICGLSGSEADNIRRAIARKQPERLERALPSILNGYCSKSEKDRTQAEAECQEFLRIIEDASSYMFGYNHSVAYCLLGYLCAYYRFYYPAEFITAFLNNAANEEDIVNGTKLARQYGYKVVSPKWGVSRSSYFFNKENQTIAKGISSLKYISSATAEALYQLSSSRHFDSFADVLSAIFLQTPIDTRQLEILIHIDFFSEFGNQRELLRIFEIFERFKRGNAKQIPRESIDGSELEPIIRRYSTWHTKNGGEAKSYTLSNVASIIRECESLILSSGMPDLEDSIKVRNFAEIMGYAGYISGKECDRKKLYVREVFQLKRKRDGKQFGYCILTQSIGSGIESKFTVFNRVFNPDPIKAGDIIYCSDYDRDGQYFVLNKFHHI